MAILRPCLDCGRLVEPPWNRCELHRKGYDRPKYRGSAASRGYGSDHQRLRTQVLREHVARHGLVCPGWLVPPHPVTHSSELQLDHVIPLADGGARDYS